MIKKISILMLAILIVGLVLNVFCLTAEATGYGAKMKSLVSTVPTNSGVNQDAKTTAAHTVASIITVIRVVGVCVAIVMLLTVAMKYMTAAAGEKAEIKKSAVQYVVGAIVLFAATGILGIISDFSKNISLGK